MAKRKAYIVPLNGVVVREFLVLAESAKQARQIMLSDRHEAMAIGDQFEETGLGRIRRAPEEDDEG